MFDSYDASDTGSFLNFRRKMLKKMKASGVGDQITALLQETFDTVIESEDVSIKEMEKKILVADISAEILKELAEQMKETR